MKIISNSISSHFKEIKYLLQDADNLLIVSPFFMESLDEFFEEVLIPLKIKGLIIVTTLKSNDADLFKKNNFLKSLLSNCEKWSISHQVYIDNMLHGKVFVAYKNKSPVSAIITSANFTENGLNHNHEWGVSIDESSVIENMISEILSNSSHPLTLDEIENIILEIECYIEDVGKINIPDIDLNVSKFIREPSLTNEKSGEIINISNNNFNDGYATINEIDAIIFYLTGKREKNTMMYEILKTRPSFEKHGSYYRASRLDLWNYFYDNYEKILERRRIEHFQDLLNHAFDYNLRHLN